MKCLAEVVLYPELLGSNGHMQEVQLYIKFIENKSVELTLVTETNTYNKTSFSYIDCLLQIMLQISTDVQLNFNNKVRIQQENRNSIQTIVEIISVVYDHSDEEYYLKFHLSTRAPSGKTICESSGQEDFTIPLQLLKNQMKAEYNICAFCENADFMSTGNEDLRYGWYCLRELSEREKDIPWFKRVEEFHNAIPYVNAFHWCPQFKRSDRSFI
ncbi:hypothetical protein D3P07_24805 [Paenibacillus sp. 1011MAR3C5]|uniref:hypothetical protein n=1 Tax=Paenibacillus sp. 1011MAR3C5 TaxID=1675787 RepID=UPI000E6BA646|nr:hypothetical protein [Paenibacillus sp. 1011MAR3C5]RJE83576.1 hypothetical protein D3P07_24805 [Paenibacillus sp. 1011MAR3C5]